MKNLQTLNKLKILTGQNNEHMLEFNHSGIFLHKDVIQPFIDLQKAARQEIGADLQIVSGFRSFERQLKIWNEKAVGKRPLLDKFDRPIEFASLSPNEIVDSILYWSAIPGCSRHHWGTDIDIFDASCASKEEVKLVSSECESGGVFERLHSWLDHYLPNTDFFRPYSTDLGGVGVEKWHLSYAPIAQSYYEQYSLELFIQHISNSEIKFKEILLQDAAEYYQKSIRIINFP